MKTVKQTLTENSLIIIISTALVKIIGALFKIPLATDYFLGDLGFGYYSIAHDIFMPFYVLAISGLPCAVSQITAEYVAKNNYAALDEKFKSTKKLFTRLGLLLAIVTVLLSLPIVIRSGFQNSAFLSVLAVVPSILLCFVISAYRGYFEGFSNMYPTAVSKIIEAVFKLSLGLIMAFVVINTTHNSAFASAAAMAAVSLGNLFATLYLKLKYKKCNPINKIDSFSSREVQNDFSPKNIFALALPYVLASLSASLVSLIDVVTVKTYFENASQSYLQSIEINTDNLSTYLYGVRSKAFTLYYLIPTITMSIGISALPVLTKFRTNNDYSSLQTNINFTLKLISVITFPASIGLIALSGPIMNLLYSSNDSLGSNLLLIYGIAALFSGFAIPLTTVLQSLNLQKRVFFSIVFGIIIKIIVNIILVRIPSVNIYSAPLGTGFCYLFMLADLVIVLNKKVTKIEFANSVLKPLVSALICGGAAFAVSLISSQKIVTVFAVLTAIIVYFIMLFITKTFFKDELKNLPIIKYII